MLINMNNEDIRDKEEIIIKNKLGEEDIDLSGISDDDLDKVVSKEDKEDFIKKASNAEDLQLGNLPDDQVDALLSKITNEEGGSSLTEKQIVEALSKEMDFKLDEAQKVYEDHLNEKTYFIDRLYESFEACDEDIEKLDMVSIMADIDLTPEVMVNESDPQKELQDQTGEKIGKGHDLPDMEYANMKDAKSTPEPMVISEEKSEENKD